MAALARNYKAVVVEIYILAIEPDAFAYTYARAEKQRQHRLVADCRGLVERSLSAFEVFSALRLVEYVDDFVYVKSDYRL